MSLWRELILNYYTHNKLKTLIVHECPLWSNPNIERKLTNDDIMMTALVSIDIKKSSIRHRFIEIVNQKGFFHSKIPPLGIQ